MKICMVAYSWDNDPRVNRYASSLIERGDRVDMICLGHKGQPLFRVTNGMHVYPIQTRDMNDEKSPHTYLKKMIKFLSLSMVKCIELHLKNRYDVIHFHNIPDFGVFCTLIPKLMGAKVILDIHDILPEYYMRKFNMDENSRSIKFIKWMEKVSCRYADHVITVTDIWRKRIIHRSVEKQKCTVVMNVPDLRIFKRIQRNHRNSKPFTLIYPGALKEHFGVDVAIRGMEIIKNHIPSVKLNIIGNGTDLKSLLKLTADLNLDPFIHFNKKALPINRIPELICNADVGIVPKRGGMFAEEALSTKLLEFVAMEIPVVVSRTRVAEMYFDDQMVMFFEPGNINDFARCVIELYNSPRKKKRLVRNAQRFTENHNWEKYQRIYFDLIDTLCEQGCSNDNLT